MKKKTLRKINLSRETLHALDPNVLAEAGGGVTSPCTTVSGVRCSQGTSCPSYCQVTNCL
jgi:hypothetical protein